MSAASAAQLAGVFDLLGPLYRQTVRNLEQASGVSVGVRAVLDLLRVRERLTVPRIADVLGLSRQFVQRCVNDAETKGWVVLETNPAHQRSSLVVVTPAGRSVVEDLRADEARTLGTVAASLDGADVEACRRVLTRLLEVVRSGAG
ncbi:MAG TPA: MarR family winged helix-turn-helix transcriptional regulator [Lapillicoccus sp.]|nr:MarR family winged helix-turn-helix transcriptional regulator [Lapillicoccus sp.]